MRENSNMPKKAKTPNRPAAAKKKRRIRFVRTERTAMAARRVRRSILLALIWLMTIAYAVGYVSFVYEKDLRLMAPNVAAQLHEEPLMPNFLADRIISMLSGRFGLRAQPPATELQSDSSTFQDVMQVLNNRADLWRSVMVTAMFVSIASAAVMHFLWRMRCNRIISPSREIPAVKARFHDLLLICIVINCLLAALLYRFGYEGQENVTLRMLAYNGVFILSPLSMILSTRLTAPMCVSGASCYFR